MGSSFHSLHRPTPASGVPRALSPLPTPSRGYRTRGYRTRGYILRLACASLLATAPVSLQAQSPVPGATTPITALTASITGIIQDINGTPIPNAAITLTHVAQGPPVPSPSASHIYPTAAIATDSGQFTLPTLPAGIYQLTASAPGFVTYVSSPIPLRPDQHLILAQIALPIATATSDVQVHVTQFDLATEQVQAEEKQRILGILPNFYTSYIWTAAPLTPGQKFRLATRALDDPFNFLASGIAAGIQQAQNNYKGYGQGAQGYAKRYGADYADNAIGTMLGGAILPTLFHQDPRYYYRGSGSITHRALYAITRAVITRGDNGRWQPNYSGVLADLSTGAISNAYHPSTDRGLGLTFGNTGLATIGGAVSNLVQEFVFRRLTTNIPTYAVGKKADPTPTP
jgi:hypothetical protein